MKKYSCLEEKYACIDPAEAYVTLEYFAPK